MSNNVTETKNALPLTTEWVNLDVSGHPMECYVARPANGKPYPAVIVLMEIFGVNDHIRSVTERVAALGYVALSPNFYHRTTKNLELGYNAEGMETGQKHKADVTRATALDDLKAAIRYFDASEFVSPKAKYATMGFCFGGHVAYIGGALPEIAAVVSFYPGGVTSASAGIPNNIDPTVAHTADIHGSVLCLFGEDDSLISHEDTVTVEQALKLANISHEVIRYAHTDHGFFCDQRGSYSASAAEDAWSRVQTLLAKTLQA